MLVKFSGFGIPSRCLFSSISESGNGRGIGTEGDGQKTRGCGDRHGMLNGQGTGSGINVAHGDGFTDIGLIRLGVVLWNHVDFAGACCEQILFGGSNGG